MSRIIEYTNPCFPNKKWFRCNIKNETYSSPIRENVEVWRDDKMINSEYYKELEELQHNSIAEYYASKSRWDNYTGD
tara:strand:+ start:459 stop:689 length:231 start_codon:yes stop_codon:yes gene_type:complete